MQIVNFKLLQFSQLIGQRWLQFAFDWYCRAMLDFLTTTATNVQQNFNLHPNYKT